MASGAVERYEGEVDNDLEKRLRATDARLNALAATWISGPTNLSYRAVVAAWGVASVARLTLLEAAHGWWWAATFVLLIGAMGLIRFGGRVWWAICGVGIAWPYFFLRDWMTQSLVLLLIAGVGTLTCGASSDGRALRSTARALAATTYLAAAFHKLNHGFFDADLSCAAYGVSKLTHFFGAETFGAASGNIGGLVLPGLIVLGEVLIGIGILVRPRSAVLAGLLFHLPLTLVLAPAFVFVMAIGYVATLSDDDLRWIRQRRPTGRTLAVGFSLSAGAAWAVGGTLGDAILGTKVAVLGLATIYALLLALRRPRLGAPLAPFGWPARVALLLFCLNALTPYWGTQTQHTGAMLSNLRIDEGCWNHFLMPESVV